VAEPLPLDGHHRRPFLPAADTRIGKQRAAQPLAVLAPQHPADLVPGQIDRTALELQAQAGGAPRVGPATDRQTGEPPVAFRAPAGAHARQVLLQDRIELLRGPGLLPAELRGDVAEGRLGAAADVAHAAQVGGGGTAPHLVDPRRVPAAGRGIERQDRPAFVHRDLPAGLLDGFGAAGALGGDAAVDLVLDRREQVEAARGPSAEHRQGVAARRHRLRPKRRHAPRRLRPHFERQHGPDVGLEVDDVHRRRPIARRPDERFAAVRLAVDLQRARLEVFRVREERLRDDGAPRSRGVQEEKPPVFRARDPRLPRGNLDRPRPRSDDAEAPRAVRAQAHLRNLRRHADPHQRDPASAGGRVRVGVRRRGRRPRRQEQAGEKRKQCRNVWRLWKQWTTTVCDCGEHPGLPLPAYPPLSVAAFP